MSFGKMTMIVKADGTVETPGVGYDSKHTLLKRNDAYVLTKTSAGKHWSGLGSPWQYHSPDLHFWRIEKVLSSKNGDVKMTVEEVMEYELSRKKP